MLARALTLIRHFSGVAVGAAGAWIANTFGVEVSPEAAAGATEAVTWVGVAVFTAGYAAGEKLLKPIFEKLGEVEAAAQK